VWLHRCCLVLAWRLSFLEREREAENKTVISTVRSSAGDVAIERWRRVDWRPTSDGKLARSRRMNAEETASLRSHGYDWPASTLQQPSRPGWPTPGRSDLTDWRLTGELMSDQCLRARSVGWSACSTDVLPYAVRFSIGLNTRNSETNTKGVKRYGWSIHFALYSFFCSVVCWLDVVPYAAVRAVRSATVDSRQRLFLDWLCAVQPTAINNLLYFLTQSQLSAIENTYISFTL